MKIKGFLMVLQFASVGMIMLASLMLPGPDFALVAKNTVMHARRAGFFTSLGIVSAVIVHMTYCILGLAVVIANSLMLFTMVKYLGAAYLIYIGVGALRSTHHRLKTDLVSRQQRKTSFSNATAFRQGFFCNLLNPKATLFFLALFTVIIKPGTSTWVQVGYGVQMIVLTALWFSLLTMMLSHQRVMAMLNKIEASVEKVLGVLLIGFGIALVFLRR